MSIFLSVLSAFFYGTADFSGGFASKKNATLPVVIISQFAGLILALIFIATGGSVFPGVRPLLFGALGGFAGAFGLYWLYRGIARTVVAIVSPASALVSALLPMIFGLFTGEKPATAAILGGALCIPAIMLLAYEKPGSESAGQVRSALSHGLLAGLGFGLFFIMLSRTESTSGLWPLVAARATTLTLFSFVSLIQGQKIAVARTSLPLVIATGLFDMCANILFLLASRIGLLFIVSCITSLYPGPTVLLARIVLGEKLKPVRTGGILLALVGVALISLR
jgi:drug/metabolite transporter (DMT)-like permease